MFTRLFLLAVAVLWGCGDGTSPPPTTGSGPEPAAASSGTVLHPHADHARDWSPVLFREPIQGQPTMRGGCAWPTSGTIALKHPKLSYTVGEFDPVTCAGTMFFGDWAADIRRWTGQNRFPKADTTRIAVGPQADNPACDHLGSTPGTIRYRGNTEWVGSVSSTPAVGVDIEYQAIFYGYDAGNYWCHTGENGYVVRNYFNSSYSAYGSVTTGASGSAYTTTGGQGVGTYDIGSVFAQVANAQRSCGGGVTGIVAMVANSGGGWPEFHISFDIGSISSHLELPPSDYVCPQYTFLMSWYASATGATGSLPYP